jgi:hypothetical protein
MDLPLIVDCSRKNFMPYTVSYDEKSGVVRIQVFGVDKVDDHYSARDEAFELCKKNKCAKLLVDLSKLDIKSRGTFGCFLFGKSVVKKSPGIKIAHVLPSDVSTRNDIKFIQTAESTQGGCCREFDTINEALHWLIE